MKNRLEISIGKKYGVAFDELKAFADISGCKVSKMIGGMVHDYMNNMKGKPKIVLDVPQWNLSEYTKEDLMELNTLIYQLNNKVAEELCRK